MLTALRFLTIVPLLALAVPVMAAGDAPQRLNQREAAAVYRMVQPLLPMEGESCPVRQTPLSGIVAGGSSPFAGSQTTTLTFANGARVTIVKRWDSMPGHASTTAVTITCA